MYSNKFYGWCVVSLYHKDCSQHNFIFLSVLFLQCISPYKSPISHLYFSSFLVRNGMTYNLRHARQSKLQWFYTLYIISLVSRDRHVYTIKIEKKNYNYNNCYNNNNECYHTYTLSILDRHRDKKILEQPSERDSTRCTEPALFTPY